MPLRRKEKSESHDKSSSKGIRSLFSRNNDKAKDNQQRSDSDWPGHTTGLPNTTTLPFRGTQRAQQSVVTQGTPTFHIVGPGSTQNPASYTTAASPSSPYPYFPPPPRRGHPQSPQYPYAASPQQYPNQPQRVPISQPNPIPTVGLVPVAITSPQWLSVQGNGSPGYNLPAQRPVTPQAPWTVTSNALQPSVPTYAQGIEQRRYFAPSPAPSHVSPQLTNLPYHQARQNGEYQDTSSRQPQGTRFVAATSQAENVRYPPQASPYVTSTAVPDPPLGGNSVSDGETEDESILDIDLNGRFRTMSDEARPVWYRKEDGCEHTVIQDAPDYLCGTCRRIDFVAILNQEETTRVPGPSELIVFGPFSGILGKSKHCGFCSLVTRIVRQEILKGLPRTATEQEERAALLEGLTDQLNDLYYLYPVRFKQEYSVPALYLCRNAWQNHRSSIISTSTVIRPDRSLGLRLIHREQPRLGRLVKKDRIDIDWIKERLAMCDDRSVRAQYRHKITIRAIDVNAMCIVDLDVAARYVALSYTWGKVKQLLLTRRLESALRRPGGLLSYFHEIPATIQDAIQLTREIGEEHLWVDAVCIIQDDGEDKGSQINEMGNIYHEAVLVIQACCGNDASYGLPGMRPGTRSVPQVAGRVGHLVMGNMLPGEEHLGKSVWGTRAWTLQEKILSRRMLMISDEVVWWWCWHSCSPEDEHCRHPYWDKGTRDQDMIFFNTEHDLIVSKRGVLANFDLYAYILSDYTLRDLTFQGDAEAALHGILKRLEGYFRGRFIHGLPSTEFENALLWCPIGRHERRIDHETGRPFFPSWSWLGWTGHAAYPWAVERAFPSSSVNSPLQWLDGRLKAMGLNLCFTGEQYRLSTASPPPDELPEGWSRNPDDPWCFTEDDSGGSHHFFNPITPESWFRARPFAFVDGDSHVLRFVTLSAHLTLGADFQKRKENYNHLHKVFQLPVLDSQGFSAGYIYTPDPATMSATQRAQFSSGRREFVVLSRASLESDPYADRDSLHQDLDRLAASLRMPRSFSASLEPSPAKSLDAAARFDNMVFYRSSPWCLFNVLMIEWDEGVAQRVSVGRVHVGAFMAEGPVEREVVLR